jgi:hypothetical protein
MLLTGRYSKRLFHAAPEITCRADLGIGYGEYSFSSAITDHVTYQSDVTNFAFAFYAALGVDIRLTAGVSLGVTGDYLLGPTVLFPTQSAPYALSKSTTLSNGSIAIELAFHI